MSHILKQKDFLNFKKYLSIKNKRLDLTKHILLGIVTGEALYPQFFTKRQKNQAIYGLRRYKFIRRVKKNKGNNYILTQKGKARLHNVVIDEIKITNQQNWDGKWHLVIYDIPIRFTKARNAFRWKLKDLGFFQFQKSAWIFPYPCEKEVLFVADFWGVRKYIEILEVDKIFHDVKLKTLFCL